MKQIYIGSAARQKQLLGRCVSQQNIPQAINIDTQIVRQCVNIPRFNVDYQLSQYQWRTNTQFPIAKILSFNPVQISQQITGIDIAYQANLFKLSDIKDLPLFKTIYLMKQVIVACERLYSRYGPFLLNSRMIFVTQQLTCRTWINQNLSINQCTSLKINEEGFLSILFNIFQEKTLKIKSSMAFFQKIKTQLYFHDARNYLQQYCRDHKIVMQKMIIITEKEIIQANSQIKKFNANSTFSKAPKFLQNKNIRSTITPQSKITINVFSPKVSKVQSPQTMKISGDTTVEENQEAIIQSIIYKDQRKEQENKNERSPLKKKGISRKFSLPTAEDQLMSFQKNNQLTPNKHLTISSAKNWLNTTNNLKLMLN